MTLLLDAAMWKKISLLSSFREH